MIPDAKLVAVANGQGEGVQFIDASDDHPIWSVKLGDDSDNVRYEMAAKRLFVGFGVGALAAVNPAEQSRLYLAVPHRGTQKAEIRIYEAR